MAEEVGSGGGRPSGRPRAARAALAARERLERVGHRVAVGRVAVPRPHASSAPISLADEVARRRRSRGRSGASSRPAARPRPGATVVARAPRTPRRSTPSGFSTSTCLPASMALERRGDVELVGDGDDHRVELRVGEHRVVVGVGACGAGGRRDRVRAGLRRGRRGRGARVARLAARLEVGGLRGDRPAPSTPTRRAAPPHRHVVPDGGSAPACVSRCATTGRIMRRPWRARATPGQHRRAGGRRGGHRPAPRGRPTAAARTRRPPRRRARRAPGPRARACVAPARARAAARPQGARRRRGRAPSGPCPRSAVARADRGARRRARRSGSPDQRRRPRTARRSGSPDQRRRRRTARRPRTARRSRSPDQRRRPREGTAFRVAGRPAIAATALAHHADTGHAAQSARRGPHTRAPSSIIAWFHGAARPAGSSASARANSSRALRRRRSQRSITRRTFTSTAARCASQANDATAAVV